MSRHFYPGILISCIFLHCFSPQNKSSSVFYYNEDAGIASLDPAFAKDQSLIWASLQLFNGLVQLDSSLHILPAIAYRWEISDSNKTYTFHLRPHVYFHQNKEVFGLGVTRCVTAPDFVYSFTRLVSPATASPGAWVFAGKIANAASAFTAPNDSTFVLRLSQPFPAMLSLLSMPYCCVVPHEAIALYGKDFRAHPIGTGPFQLQAWHEGVKLLLSRNPLYFETDKTGHKLPYLQGVEVSFMESKQAAFFEFVKGRLDFLNGLESSFKDEILTRRGRLRQQYRGQFNVVTAPYLNTEYLAFNLDSSHLADKDNPLANPLVRQAIGCAIDRQTMLSYLRNNLGNGRVRGFVPDGLPGTATENYAYNPSRSRQLLAASGIRFAKPLVISTTKSYVDLTVYIQAALQAVGIPATIEVNPGPTHRQMVSSGQLAFFRGSWIADYPDAENYLSLFYSKNASPAGPNTTHFSNAQYDAWYRAANRATTLRHRDSLYACMDSLLMQHCPAVVLFYDRSIRLVQNKVQGLETNPMNNLVLKRVRKLAE